MLTLPYIKIKTIVIIPFSITYVASVCISRNYSGSVKRIFGFQNVSKLNLTYRMYYRQYWA